MSEHASKALMKASQRLERAAELAREAAQMEANDVPHDELLWQIGEAIYDVTLLVPRRPLPYATEPRCGCGCNCHRESVQP
jgi:hypothetical protein